MFSIFYKLSARVYNKLVRTVPGFDTIMEKVDADAAAREAIRREKRAAQKAAKEKALYDRFQK